MLGGVNVDTYYGRKLQRPPTTGGTSNLFSLGVNGFRIRKGQLAEPVSEPTNVAGTTSPPIACSATGDGPSASERRVAH